MKKLVVEVAGIGQATSIVLAKHGFKTVDDIAGASIESLSAVPGFAGVRSVQTIKKAKALLEIGEDLSSEKVSESTGGKKKEGSKKSKKAKKIAKKSKDKKVVKNKVKLVAKELAKKVAKLKNKKAAKDKAKKSSSKTAAKKKKSKKSKKK